MENQKTELPSEIRINDKKHNRQLRTIVQITNRWLNVLFHESNGLLSNVNWISQLLGDDINDADLPKAVFRELNQNTQKNIYTLRVIQQYIQVLNVVAEKNNQPNDYIILNKALLLTSVPRLEPETVSFGTSSIEVTRTFARVLSFLLQKLIDHISAFQDRDSQLHITLDLNQEDLFYVRIEGSASFWHHELWENGIFELNEPVTTHSDHWPKVMFYELLSMVGGKVLSGFNGQRDFTSRTKKPKLASELINKEISGNYLAFCLPLNL